MVHGSITLQNRKILRQSSIFCYLFNCQLNFKGRAGHREYLGEFRNRLQPDNHQFKKSV